MAERWIQHTRPRRRCAHVHEAKVLAVATGEYSLEQLAAADWQVPDLTDTASVLSLLMDDCGSLE